MPKYDALLLVSYGGPERMEDVMPFLRNVVEGLGVPDERLQKVADHYALFDGVSPSSEELRGMLSSLLRAFASEEGDSPAIYWGNLFWHPTLEETIAQMASDGVTRALAFCTSAYKSYSGCRKYSDAIAAACEKVGEGAPPVDKIKPFFDQPGFLEPMADRVARAIGQLPEEDRDGATVLFTAHSLPITMADQSPYVEQLETACDVVAKRLKLSDWKLAWQSRSGPPRQPWLEPDVGDLVAEMKPGTNIVVAPIGFCFENMETVYDLDTVLRAKAEESGVTMVRAMTVGADPRFIQMILDLYYKYESADSPPRCADGCCPPPMRKP